MTVLVRTLAASILVTATAPAIAQTPAEFYKGKNGAHGHRRSGRWRL